MSTVVVHDTINVNGTEYARGEAIHGDLADEVLANQIWASKVTRVPDGTIDPPSPTSLAAPAPAAPVTPAAVPPAPSSSITDTTKAPT